MERWGKFRFSRDLFCSINKNPPPVFSTILLEHNAKAAALCFPSDAPRSDFQRFVLKSECSQLPSPPPRSLRGSFSTSPGIITRFSFSPSFSPLNALPLRCLANYGADFLLLSILYQIAYAMGGDQRNAKQHRGWEAANNNYFTCTLGRISLAPFLGVKNKVINW